MPVLKSLSFTAMPKSASDPVHIRRAKFIEKLEEQKLLLEDPGYVRTIQRMAEMGGQTHAPATTIAGLQMRALIVAGTLDEKDQDDFVLSNLRSPSATGRGLPVKNLAILRRCLLVCFHDLV